MRVAAKQIARFLVLMLLAGFLATVLVVSAPGFGIEERSMDSRYSHLSSKITAQSTNVFVAYGNLLRNVVRGDFGYSASLSRPVSNLLRERIPTTVRNIGLGLVLAWTAGVTLAAAPFFRTIAWLRWPASAIANTLLCLPSSLTAFAVAYLSLTASYGVAAVIFPRIFRLLDNLLSQTASLPHVIGAQARGVSEFGLLANHVARNALPQAIVVAGVTVNIALGAAIPIEVLCDQPGIGQLAWKAAMSRDLQLLVPITLLILGVTLTANGAAEMLAQALKRKTA